MDPDLLDNLRSPVHMGSKAALTVIMTIDDPRDPARDAIEAAIPSLHAAGFEAALEIHPPRGANRKASLLAAVLAGPRVAATEPELIVNADSNVDLRDFPLDQLLAPLLAEDRVGACWAPWAEETQGRSLGALASAAVLGGSLAAFPLLCGLDPQGLVGKLWAARREALEAIGGLEPLVDYLGEDFEMARRLRAAGWSIAVASVLGRARGGNPAFSKVVERFARWMLVVRAQRPLLLLTYPTLFFATPLVLLLALLGSVERPGVAAIAVTMALVARVLITAGARHWSRRRGLASALLDAPLSDLTLGLAWLRALSSRAITWRGHHLRVGRDGRLSTVDP